METTATKAYFSVESSKNMSLRSKFLNADSYKAKTAQIWHKVVVPIMWVVLVDDVEAGVAVSYTHLTLPTILLV